MTYKYFVVEKFSMVIFSLIYLHFVQKELTHDANTNGDDSKVVIDPRNTSKET